MKYPLGKVLLVNKQYVKIKALNNRNGARR